MKQGRRGQMRRDLTLMLLVSLILLALLWVGCFNDTTLGPLCDLPCNTLHKANLDRRNVGACRDGRWACDEAGRVLDCEGEILPAWEACDGVDNNCNGQVDEMAPAAFITIAKQMCNTHGACAGVRMGCENGEYTCLYPDHVDFGPETFCDGIDNDCDGRVDEDITLGYCYTGPIGTETQPPCHPGVLTCVNGSHVCVNQVVPTPEICDGVDNNCDSVADNTEAYDGGNDLAFVLDTSGSMQIYINAVVAAIDAYLGSFLGNPDFRFALVIMNHPTPDYVAVLLDFTDIQTFRDLLVQIQANGAATENSVGAIYQVCDRETNPLGLSWRSNSVGVLFELTDEAAQDYTGATAQTVIETCLHNGVLPAVWGRYTDELHTIATNANGTFFQLSTSWEVVYNDMQSIVIKLCRD